MRHIEKALPGGNQNSASNRNTSLDGNPKCTHQSPSLQSDYAERWIERRFFVSPARAHVIARLAEMGGES